MISIWPSLLWLALTLVGIGLQWGADNYKFSDLVANVLIGGLLYWGGFFDPIIRVAG